MFWGGAWLLLTPSCLSCFPPNALNEQNLEAIARQGLFVRLAKKFLVRYKHHRPRLFWKEGDFFLELRLDKEKEHTARAERFRLPVLDTRAHERDESFRTQVSSV
jgi:hypothetical protein